MRLLAILLPLFLLIGCQSNPNYSDAPQMDSVPDPTSLYRQGRMLFDQADYQGAIQYFTRAVDINPNYADAYFALGNTYMRLNAAQQALQAYQDCLRILPHHAEANLNIALIYFDRFEYVPAESYFRKAMNANPANPLSYFYLAEIYKKQHQCKEPRELYQKALSIKPDFYDAKEGLREIEKRCTKAVTPAASPYEKQHSFGGGAKALKPGEW